MSQIKVSIGVDVQKNRELSISEKIVISHACELICDRVDVTKLNWIQFEFENEKE